jgi:hypothetical protein
VYGKMETLSREFVLTSFINWWMSIWVDECMGIFGPLTADSRPQSKQIWGVMRVLRVRKVIGVQGVERDTNVKG